MITSSQSVRSEDVADHYDDLDAFYREVWGEHLHHGLWLDGRESPRRAVEQLVGLVAERAAIGAGTRVCDVGCGYGETARLLHGRGASVTGLTLSGEQYSRAAAAAAAAGDGRLHFVHGDWLANELPDASFDAVIAIESTEHMVDKKRCLGEAARVLVPEGRLVICAWLVGSAPRRWESHRLLEPICREGRIPGMGDVEDYRRWIQQAGLVATGFEDLTPRVTRTWSICIRRVVRSLLRRPEYRRYLFSAASRNRCFAWTLLRIRVAYATGAMRYGLFAATKPAS